MPLPALPLPLAALPPLHQDILQLDFTLSMRVQQFAVSVFSIVVLAAATYGTWRVVAAVLALLGPLQQVRHFWGARDSELGAAAEPIGLGLEVCCRLCTAGLTAANTSRLGALGLGRGGECRLGLLSPLQHVCRGADENA